MFYLAFSLGLMSSLHCIGMCGPIALALPVHHRSFYGKTLGILSYNLGRAFTYSLLGFLLGSLGTALNLAGLQRFLSVGSGLVMLGAVAYSSHWLDQLSTPLPLQKSVAWLKKKLGVLLSRRSFGALFTLGVLNGFLPCGLVYMALISSFAVGNAAEGALFMGLFGLGTLPAMSAVGFVKNIFSVSFRSKARQLMPAIVAATALLLIIRGFQFSGDSFFHKSSPEIPICHGK